MDANTQPLVRTFAALAVFEPVRAALSDFERQARRIRVRVGWVRPENLHVTLAFLGYVPEEGLRLLSDAFDDAARQFHPFDFETAGIGWFGGRRPRVIWAGIPAGDGADAVTAVAGAVRTAAGLAGYPDDERRPFAPHVTVGRLRPGSDPAELVEWLGKRHRETAFGLTHASGIRLMRSDLGDEGTVYSVLHESPFL